MADKNLSKCETSVYLWLLKVVIVLVLTCLAMWAVLIPKPPIVSFSGMHLKLRSGKNSSSLVFNLTVWNPNVKFGVLLEGLNVTLYCKNDVVGSGSVPGFFYVGHKNRTDVGELEMAVYGRVVSQFGGGIAGGIGKMEMRAAVEAIVRYQIVRYKTKNRRLVFEDCVHLGPGGRMLVISRVL